MRRTCTRPPTPDHPHAGGENHLLRGKTLRLLGPSPRGWGERLRGLAKQFGRRTIPTRVGRTLTPRISAGLSTDHPHAGGENNKLRGGEKKVRGPSPRGWGELGAGEARVFDLRTIPTRVGRTVDIDREWFTTADHPHAGGENAERVAAGSGDGGPSPRGWGEQQRAHLARRVFRTIPTRVGRTPTAPSRRRWAEDHPHAGGENATVRLRTNTRHGPSPRGWGERQAHE